MTITKEQVILHRIVEDFEVENIYDVWDLHELAYSLGYKCYSGASKTMLYLPEFGDYVVKLSIGEDELGSSYNKEGGDFLEEETRIYEMAEEEGLERFFANTIRIGTITPPSLETIGVYIQKKVDTVFCDTKCYENYDAENAYRKEKAMVRYFKINRHIASPGMYYLIRKEGLKEAMRFFTFINENGLTDLHAANFGINVNGQLVLFDYSGYDSAYGSSHYLGDYDEYEEYDEDDWCEVSDDGGLS